MLCWRQMRAMQRLKAVEWEMRMQPLEELLERYKTRHNACVNAKKLPGKYLVVRFEDKDAGIGNQLPSVVSGAPCTVDTTLKSLLLCQCIQRRVGCVSCRSC